MAAAVAAVAVAVERRTTAQGSTRRSLFKLAVLACIFGAAGASAALSTCRSIHEQHRPTEKQIAR